MKKKSPPMHFVAEQNVPFTFFNAGPWEGLKIWGGRGEASSNVVGVICPISDWNSVPGRGAMATSAPVLTAL